MKRLVLAFALTGLMSVTVLAGDVPINGAPTPAAPTTSSTASTSSTVLVTVILTVLGLR